MSIEEVCRILEVSAQSGVAVLKFGGLHVRFGKKPEPGLESPEQPIPASAPETVLSEAQHQKQTASALEADEIELRNEQLAHALVEDPLKFEELLQNGELSDDALDGSEDPDDE